MFGILHKYLSRNEIARFLYNRYREIKIFYRDYLNSFNEGKKGYVVFMVDGKLRHGGLADRLYGIITTFAVCKIKNIPFKLYFVYPFEIECFLVPNTYNWIIEENDLAYNKKTKIMVAIQEEQSFKRIKLDRPEDLAQFTSSGGVLGYWFGVAISSLMGCIGLIGGGGQIHYYSNFNDLNKINTHYGSAFTFTGLFNELFKLSVSFKNKFDYILENKIRKPYVAICFRFQNLLGDFTERNYKEMDKDGKKELIELCFLALTSIAKNNKNIFLASDSRFFLKEAGVWFEYVYSCGGFNTPPFRAL
jgi:hypothetical protein